VIRAATPADARAIHEMICELADYEKEPDAVVATVADLESALFAEVPLCHSLIAESDGEAVGFALWFVTYSTWQGRHGVYLEDLYVRPEHRGAGHGKRLLTALAAVARERGYARFEWSVLDWNAPSIEFYRRMGAQPVSGWTKYRLSGEALHEVADAAGD